MIIGICGTNAAGKGEATKYLVERHGFVAFSLSDVLREELALVGAEVTRENLIEKGNRLREAEGPAVLARRVVERIKQQSAYEALSIVIDSIRNPSEVEELRKLPGFYLVAIDAPVEFRFEREKERGRVGAATMLEQFVELEKLERSTDPNKQQLDTVIQMADRVIQNHWILAALHREVERIVYRRPSWDEYFMKLAFLVAERSTCLRHHVGAVIVRNKKILTTGYNGAPAGAEDSLQLGCLRDQLHIASGERQEICRATHAEQNALIQASLHGVTTQDATIYCTHSPCIICAKLMVNAGVKRVVSCRPYPDETFKALFNQTGVEYLTVRKPPLAITVLD